MSTCIALLRGINVSGQKKIKMADLRKNLEDLGFQKLHTYIQSGNIVFQSQQANLEDLASKIRENILDHYGFEVPVQVHRPADYEYILRNNPFLTQRSEDTNRLYVTFLAGKPDPELVAAIDAAQYHPEEFVQDGPFIFLFSPKGYGRAKMNNNFFERQLKIQATTRNWKTINKLYEMAKSI